MLRRVLTVYLAMLTAAAPCLCCCTAGRLLAAPPPIQKKPASKAPCCCHEAEPPDHPQPAPGPHAPAPEKRCPCRAHVDLQGQVTIAPKAVDLDLLRAVLDAANVAAPAADPTPVTELVGPIEPREPSPSTFDLLRVHHRLRC